MTQRRLTFPQIGASVAVLATLLAGCGGVQTATPAAPQPTVGEPSPVAVAATSGSVARDASAGRDTSGPSAGVEHVKWPADASGAYKLMSSLPPTIGDAPLELFYQPAEPEFGAEAVAVYGISAALNVIDEYVTSDTESGKPELLTASELLAASFGLVFACDEKSYRGTIKPLDGGVGPGYTPPKNTDGTPWFSCDVDGAEGDESFRGYAVGWTSKKAAWLVVAEDQKTARALIAGLHASTK